MSEACDCDEGQCYGESCGCQGANTRPHRCDRCRGSGYLPAGDLVQVRREELEALRELEQLERGQTWVWFKIKSVLDRLDALRREGERDG